MALTKLAVRNLRRNRRRTALTLGALVFGVMAMVGVRGFINGMQKMLMENVVYGALGPLQVHKKGYQANVLTSPLTLDMADTPELRQKMLSVPHVKAVAARIDFGSMLSMPDKSEAEPGKVSFLAVTGVEPAEEMKVTPRRFSFIDKGRTFPPADAPEIVLNADFAKGMDAQVHDASKPLPEVEQMAALMGPDRDGALNGENIVLGGTFPSFQPGPKGVGMVPLWLAQRMLRMEGRVTTYAVAVDRLDHLEPIRDQLQAALGPEYEVFTWSEIFPFLKSMMATQDFIFSILFGVILSVVLLGIVNAMLMTVLERTREIGTMLAVGMKRRQVVSLFLLEGAVQGIVGGVAGMLLGALLVYVMGRVGINLPAPGAQVSAILRPFVPLSFMIGVAIGAPFGASVACLWPAWRASRLRPVEALQSV